MLSRLRPCWRSRIGTLTVQGRAGYSTKVQEHDVILLQQKGPKGITKRHITEPLRAGSKVKLGHGASVDVADLLGKSLPHTITDSKGYGVRLRQLTLPQYVSNIPRVATPIYPQDSSMIVSILDINLPAPGEDPAFDAGPRYEIFEAGTGMGSLSMHIARALHGANPPVPQHLRNAVLAAPYKKHILLRDVATNETSNESLDSEQNGGPHPSDFAELLDPTPAEAESEAANERAVNQEAAEAASALEHQLEKYRESRRAVLHTLDIGPSTSRQAHGVIRGFRRGLYLFDMDFHVSTIRTYIERRFAEQVVPGTDRPGSREPFLNHAILDLPGASRHADVVVEALKPDGRLVIFFPSVTQVMDFVSWANETVQPMHLLRVIELPSVTYSGGAFQDGIGGREWDVRVIAPRKKRPKTAHVETGHEAGELRDVSPAQAQQDDEPDMVRVCRPKVGNLLGGGGFLAVFSKRPKEKIGDASSATVSSESSSSSSP